MNNFEQYEIQKAVMNALTLLFQKDRVLLGFKSAEQSISSRIGMHLYIKLQHAEEAGFCVDCEYRKAAGQEKAAPAEYQEETGCESIRPDIIIHKRAEENGDPTKNNVLCCEVKQGKNIDKDEVKIYGILRKYKYEVGLIIYDISPNGVSLKWIYPDSETNEKYKWDGTLREIK